MRAELLKLGSVLLIVGVATLGIAAPPSIAAPSIDTSLNPDGSGTLAISPSEESSWEACNRELECTPFATGSQISTGNAPEGTIFKASVGGRAVLSPAWGGNVFLAKRPSLRGDVRANEFVAPLGGDWRGGWPGYLGITQLAVCRTPGDSDCIVLSNHRIPCMGMPGGAVIDPAFTGWHLRLAEEIQPVGGHGVYSHPLDEPAFPASAISYVAIVGQIAAATGPAAMECGTPQQTQASISGEGVATVRCGAGCHAVLVAKRKRRNLEFVREVAPTPLHLAPKDLPRLRFPQTALSRLGAGRIRIAVLIDGEWAAGRTIVLRQRFLRGRALGDR